MKKTTLLEIIDFYEVTKDLSKYNENQVREDQEISGEEDHFPSKFTH